MNPDKEFLEMSRSLFMLQDKHEAMKASLLSFIQANPRISKDAFIEGIKEIIKNK